MLNQLWRILIFLSPFICVLATGILFEVGYNNVGVAMALVSVFWTFAHVDFGHNFGSLFYKEKKEETK